MKKEQKKVTDTKEKATGTSQAIANASPKQLLEIAEGWDLSDKNIEQVRSRMRELQAQTLRDLDQLSQITRVLEEL